MLGRRSTATRPRSLTDTLATTFYAARIGGRRRSGFNVATEFVGGPTICSGMAKSLSLRPTFRRDGWRCGKFHTSRWRRRRCPKPSAPDLASKISASSINSGLSARATVSSLKRVFRRMTKRGGASGQSHPEQSHAVTQGWLIMAALPGRHDPDEFATAMRNTAWRDAAATAARQPGAPPSARPPSPGLLFTDVPVPAPEPPGPWQGPRPGQDAGPAPPEPVPPAPAIAPVRVRSMREIMGLPPRNFSYNVPTRPTGRTGSTTAESLRHRLSSSTQDAANHEAAMAFLSQPIARRLPEAD